MIVKIAMIGTGYVGLVTGACFAELGHDVICVDHDQTKIDKLNAGIMPIYEPGLEELVKRNAKRGLLRFTLDLSAAARDRDVFFICVGTPSDPLTGRADLRYVHQAAISIGKVIRKPVTLVTKSTVPVGTNREIADIAAAHLQDGAKFHIASNPEFLREGAAISDFMEPDRVVIGADNAEAKEVMRRVYAPLIAQNVPLLETSVETAEVTKYAANAFLAIKVSYINEIADLCERVGADVEDVARGMGLDQRIGPAFLNTGPGWGGSCFPKDTKALHATAKDQSLDMRIVKAAMNANDERKRAMADKVVALCGGSVSGKRIALLGLTFKGQTDDIRDSPSLDIVAELEAKGARIHAYDPSSPHEAANLLPNVNLASSPEAAARDADALVVVTDWKIFKTFDLAAIAAVMKHPVMADLRNMYDAKRAAEAGFKRYIRLGTPAT
jgi:UDPglucose 6-dehydrogenase